MADDKKTKVVMNCSARSFSTSKGELRAGESIELPLEEALKLLKYHEIKDAALKVPAQANEIDKLKAENTELKKQNTELKKQLEDKPAKGGKKGASKDSDAPEPRDK